MMSAEKHSGRPVGASGGGVVRERGVTAKQVGNRILSFFGFDSHLDNRGRGGSVCASKATLM